MRPSPSDASLYPLTPAHPAHTPAHTTRPAHPRIPQGVPGAGSPAALHSLVEELVRFRLKVRQFALASGEAPGEARRQLLLERRPLLEACDELRRDLAVHGISIKVSAPRGRGSAGVFREHTRPWLGPAPEPRHLPVQPPGAACLLRTGAARPRGSCWIRGQKTPHPGAEDGGREAVVS